MTFKLDSLFVKTELIIALTKLVPNQDPLLTKDVIFRNSNIRTTYLFVRGSVMLGLPLWPVPMTTYTIEEELGTIYMYSAENL